MRIVVIGAMIIGLATAAELVARGHEVVADPIPAAGASHAAARMLAVATEAAWGQERLLLLVCTAADAYLAFVSGLTCGAPPLSGTEPCSRSAAPPYISRPRVDAGRFAPLFQPPAVAGLPDSSGVPRSLRWCGRMER